MKYEWVHNSRHPRQHWLYAGMSIVGLVYRVKPTAYSVYGEECGPFARTFLGEMPTLDDAKALLVTVTASQNL